MQALLNHIESGKVYRRSDLEYFSSAIDRHLGQLTKDGIFVKLAHGMYYAPKVSKFGILPPDDLALISCFLNDKDFLVVSPNSYNTLGLGLTQLYNTTWIYNHKRKGEFRLNGKTFEFKIKSSFPTQISKEFLLVDLINNVDAIAEDQLQIFDRLPDHLNRFNVPYIMEIVHLYGSGKTKKLLKMMLRSQLQHA